MKSTKKLFIMGLIINLSILASCENEDILKSSGKHETKIGEHDLSHLKGADDVEYFHKSHELFIALKDQAIARVDPFTGRSEIIGKTPLSPAGMDVVGDSKPRNVFFCALKFFGDGVIYKERVYNPDELPGVYNMDVETGHVERVLTALPIGEDSELLNQSIPIESLNTENSRPFTVCNDLIVSSDKNRIFVVESSQEETENGPPAIKQIIYKLPHGKVWEINLNDNSITLLAGGLKFPNGILLGYDKSYQHVTHILISEMSTFSILRIDLNNEYKSTDIVTLITGLPGLPDGMTRGPWGDVYVALFKEVTPTIEHLQAHPEELDKLKDVPYDKLPIPKRTGFAILNKNASKIRATFFHDGSFIKEIPALTWGNERLYFSPFADDSSGIYWIGMPTAPNFPIGIGTAF